MIKRRQNQTGYTLLELVFVVSIITLLAAMLVPQILVQRDRIVEAQAQRQLRTIGSVMADYALTNRGGSYAEFQDLKDSNMIRADVTLSSLITDYSLAFITNDLRHGPDISGDAYNSEPGNPGSTAPPHGYTIIAYPRPERSHARLSTFAITETNVVRVYKPGPGVSLNDPDTWDPIL